MSWKWQKERVASLGVCPIQPGQHYEARQKQRVSWPDEFSVALLIDGDHNPASSIGLVQSLAERLGPLSLQWVYGNWATGSLKSWQQILCSHRLEARRLRRSAFGKNGADITLTVDAMLLYGEGVRKFVLVASDSDYTPLVEALCALGCLVLVIGKATTPLALQQAASAFRHIDHHVSPEPLVPVYTCSRAAYPVVLPQADCVGSSNAVPKEAIPLQPGATPAQVQQWVLQRLREYEPIPHGWVQVPSFRDVLRSTFGFRPKDYKYKDIMGVLKAFPEVFELRLSPGQNLVHDVRRQ